MSDSFAISTPSCDNDDSSNEDSFNQKETGLIIMIGGKEIDISNGWPTDTDGNSNNKH